MKVYNNNMVTDQPNILNKQKSQCESLHKCCPRARNFDAEFYSEIRNQKSVICLFNPFISYIEYSLIYIYKHMGQGDIC